VLAVAGLQYLRTRDTRVLWLAVLFAELAAGRTRGLADGWVRIWDLAAAATGLALAFFLAPRPRHP
jgi:hypothetical protein